MDNSTHHKDCICNDCRPELAAKLVSAKRAVEACQGEGTKGSSHPPENWQPCRHDDKWQLALFEHFAAQWDAGDFYTMAIIELIADQEGSYAVIAAFDKKRYAIPKAWITRQLVRDMHRLWRGIKRNKVDLDHELEALK